MALLLLWINLPPTALDAQHLASNIPPLKTIREVRHLSPKEAARAYPVHLVGVVTALAGQHKAFFVQDETAGISVNRADATEVSVGDRVDITGVTNPGLFAPSIISSHVRSTGQAPQPPATPAGYTDLLGGAQDSKRIELTGVVHTAKIGPLFEHEVLFLGLDIGGTTVKLMIQDFAGIDYLHLIDATIRVSGVCATEFNDKRQFIGTRLFVPSRKDVEVVQAAGTNPFAGQIVPVRQALQFGQALHRLKVAGVVTWQEPGHLLYLQDGEDGIRIQTAMTDAVEPGTPVEAVGFPATGEYAPVLRSALYRVTGRPVPLKPLLISAADVISHDAYFNQPKHDGQLVQIKGKVIESRLEGADRALILGESNQVFEADLFRSSTRQKGVLPTGSMVMLTGVCIVIADADRNPISFAILLRTPQDIVILKRASWWTPGHAMWVLFLFAGTIMAVVLWVAVLRYRVERQTHMLRESEERFRDLAQRDVLTGLHNRLMLEEHIAMCLLRCGEDGCKAAIFTIDIDRFKQINDTYGHPAGDECLKVVAARLRHAASEKDTLARTGGEEFTLVAGGLATREDAEKIAARILDLFRDPVVLGEWKLGVTVSVGCALYPDDGFEGETLRKRSDQALYEAKRTGRNRAVFASKELSAQLERDSLVETAIRNALQSGSFFLVYQPIYDATGTIRRLEALLRTTDPLLAQLGPEHYIPIAESSGLILPIGRWVLQEACRHIAAWQASGYGVCPIALNVTVSQLLQEGFLKDVLQVLDSYGLHPSALEFELSEAAAMTHFDLVAERIVSLARTGITFTIDDFGNGYFSVARLHQLPIRTLKIARSFVEDIEESRETNTVTQAIIKMAQSLDLQAAAKGVERPEQLNLLRKFGCDLFQGYLLARPMPAHAITSIFVSETLAGPFDRLLG